MQICVHIIVHNYRTQHSTEQFWLVIIFSHPLDKHQSSAAVYWRGGDIQQQICNKHLHLLTNIGQHPFCCATCNIDFDEFSQCHSIHCNGVVH